MSGFSQGSGNSCKKIIQNPELTTTFPCSAPTDPFAWGCISSWRNLVYSPQYTYSFYSSNTAAFFWAQQDLMSQNLQHGECFGQNIQPLDINKHYAFSVFIKSDSILPPQITGNVEIFLTKQSAVPPSGWFGHDLSNTILNLNINRQIILNYTPTTSFIQQEVCFKPTDNWDLIGITGIGAGIFPNNVIWFVVDDAELYDAEAFAGNDKAFCDTFAHPTTLGEPCLDPPLHMANTFKWYADGSLISTSPQIFVSPNKTTTYRLDRTLGTCITFDEVIIRIFPPPIVDLGPDTTYCGDTCVVLTAGIDTLNYTYKWNTNDTTPSITVCKSGTYSVIVTGIDTACFDTDAVKIILRPDIQIKPTDTVICKNSLPYRIEVDSGNYTYLWSPTYDTTYYTHIDSTGNYKVTVTDTFGCVKNDSVYIEVLEPPFIELDSVIHACSGDFVLLNPKVTPPNAQLHYFWNTTDTTRKITVNTSGRYIVTAWTADSCIDSDYVDVYFDSLPYVHCGANRIYCLNDLNDTFDCLMIGGLYTGKGVSPSGIFSPLWAGVGTHTITYSRSIIYGSIICSKSDSFQVTVKDVPDVEIDISNKKYFCITDSTAYIIKAIPDNGVWGGIYANTDPHLTDSNFFPYIAGVGIHLITYSVFDSITGCSNADTIYMTVYDTFNVQINALGAGLLCEGGSLDLEAVVTDRLYHEFYWLPNHETVPIITITQGGTYTVYVTNEYGGCIDSAIFDTIALNCCDSSVVAETENIPDSILQGQVIVYTDQTLFIDRNIKILGGASLTFQNCKVYMRNCSKIIVVGTWGYQNNGESGLLTIDNTEIGKCEWQGVEVWGNWDACSDNWNAHGKVVITSSQLTNANIGIFAGKRGNNYPHEREYAGGIVYVHNSHFKHNYVDIMFSEWSFNEICTCDPNMNPNGQFWYSDIQNNLFDTLAQDGSVICDFFVNQCLQDFNQNYGHPCIQLTYIPPPAPPSRCHIVDLSPYTEVLLQDTNYVTLCNSNPPMVCRKCAWKSGATNPPITPQVGDGIGNITNNNIYIDPCHQNTPNTNYK